MPLVAAHLRPTGIRATDPVTWTNPENGRSVVLPFRGMKLQGPQCDGQRKPHPDVADRGPADN